MLCVNTNEASTVYFQPETGCIMPGKTAAKANIYFSSCKQTWIASQKSKNEIKKAIDIFLFLQKSVPCISFLKKIVTASLKLLKLGESLTIKILRKFQSSKSQYLTFS